MEQTIRPIARDSIAIQHLDIFIGDTEETVFVALAGHEVIGTVHLEYRGKRSAYAYFLYVREDWRRLGVGSQLMHPCCKVAVEAGCETIGLQVAKNNNVAMAMYRKMGFVFAYEYEDGSALMSMTLGSPSKSEPF